MMKKIRFILLTPGGDLTQLAMATEATPDLKEWQK